MADGRIGFAATELLFDDANPYVDDDCSLMSTEFYAAPGHQAVMTGTQLQMHDVHAFLIMYSGNEWGQTSMPLSMQKLPKTCRQLFVIVTKFYTS